MVSLTSTKGGEIVEEIPDPNEVEEVCITVLPSSLPMPVVYSYTVSNDGGVFPITNISVIDEVFGEVPGSPITSLAPDESVTLTLTATLSDEQTNVATAVGHVILGLCETSGEATITRAELPVLPGECESKLKSLLLKYIGPDIADATVVFVTDTFDTPVIYAGVNLVNGTILSLPTENGYTIDASAHGETDLGPKLTILINNVPEVIHTSCSVPVYRQAPAPLNEPKGAPSPNWFVLEFDEKN